MNKILAFIPARSGSKGLKDKNIRILGDKSLLGHTIVCAQQSGLFDEIHVSTDDAGYADIAAKYGAPVAFLRPDDLATDTASTLDVLKHVLYRFEKEKKNFTISVILQPTSPLRSPEDIQSAYDLFVKNNADAVISVCETDHSPLWCNTLPENHSMDKFVTDYIGNKNRQALETYYRINGAVYIIRNENFIKSKNLYTDKSYAYIMPKNRSVDIDDELDFIIAETLLMRG